MTNHTLQKKIQFPILARAITFVLSAFYTSGYALPVASFHASPLTGCAPMNVHFTNSSTGAVAYYWDLGNGNSSTLPDPDNLYASAGNYTITLIATDASGNTDTARYIGYITVLNNPSADFNSNNLASCVDGNQFTFINTSAWANAYQWDFGDGTISTTANPIHHYHDPGYYTITLIASNGYGCQDVKIQNQYIHIYPNPDTLIHVNANVACDPAAAFQFSNAGNETATWLWNFGDNTTSSLQNPTHVFSQTGSYQVSLITTSPSGCRDTSSAGVLIQVGVGYASDFICLSDTGCAPFVAGFSNSIPANATLHWDFGDGATDYHPYPSHTYLNPGNYTVSLIVSATGCNDTIVKSSLVHVGAKPSPDFTYNIASGCAPLNVQFTNTSTSFTSCEWIFGDGSTSTDINPMHTYTTSGAFDVTLKCYGDLGCSTSIVRNGIITVTSTHVVYTAAPRIGCPPLDVNFSSLSSSAGLSYTWIFGDGGTSSLQNPSHTYTATGSFDIILVVRDALGCIDTIRKPAYVQTINPAANYIAPPTTVGCAPLTAQFTDATAGAIAWLWNFGDGSTSTQQNPVHTYYTSGFYTVSLTTTSAGGGCAQTINTFNTFDVHGGYAAFSHTATPCPPYIASFRDSSQNAQSWFWDFGDGITDSSQNPTHTFGSPGYHSVSLTITTADGCTYTTMQSNSIYFPPFGANFFGIQQGTTYPMGVQFHANSVGATAWYWSFGDSTFSSLENPLHVYLQPGQDSVTLMITNGLCTLVYAPPTIDFGDPDTTPVSMGNPGVPVVQQGCVPLNVTFTKVVPGGVSWQWDFGDGGTSNEEFPSHLYTVPGIYTVTLSAIDSIGVPLAYSMDSMVRVSGPTAGFSIIQTNSCTTSQASFIDTSKNASQWNWNFGDGSLDTTRSPVHLFNGAVPNYVVTQTVQDTMGCSSSISTSLYASFISPLIVSESEICGPDTVHFYTSLQHFANYHWDFGDGSTADLPAAAHLYTQEGTFNVSLSITDNSGCVQTFQMNPPVSVSLPQANFSTPSPRQACDRTTTQFINQSGNADQYIWNFGDGNVSQQENPIHTYDMAGQYDVSLTVYRGNCANTFLQPHYIRVDTAHAEFARSIHDQCLPITAAFTDFSVNPVSWSWNFGDGDTSSQQNPVHTYIVPPCCFQRLIITDIHGCVDTAHMEYFPILKAKFVPSQDTGCIPMRVSFTDQSVAADSWYWDFGDGTTSTSPSPVHTYTQPGTYDVSLVVSGVSFSCSDTMRMVSLIHVKQPHANFASPDLAACAPSLVNFNDLSADADHYLWDFGDSATSTNANPSHIYNRPGYYSVTLIAGSDAGCSDTLSRPMYIRVLGPVTDFSASAFDGCSPLPVMFTDRSVNAVEWNWSFGDGYADMNESPVHIFSDTGSFTVSLVTKDTAGCSSYLELPSPVTVRPSPKAQFNATGISGCQPVTVTFTNQSTGAAQYAWDFADGYTEQAINPTHTFSQSGVYGVSLVATNNFGCTDTFMLPQPVQVLATPQASFLPNASQGCSPFPASFLNTSSNTDSATYSWDFGNGMRSSDSDPNYVYTVPGFYTVSLTVRNGNGCLDSISYPNLIQVFDSIPPPESKILSVSVTSNSTVEITWENNTAIDLAAYVLYRLNPATSSFETIYTETNIQNTGFTLNPAYTDTGLNTLQHSYSYKLNAYDVCGNAIPLQQLTAHTTIDVSSYAINPGIRVTWTPYGGCPVGGYEIYRSEHGENSRLLASVPADSLAYTDTTYQCPYPYSYRIKALDLCGNPYASYSDTSVTIPENILANQVVNVVRSTVIDNQWILTEWKPPVVHPDKVVQFDIYRSTDQVNFTYLATASSLQTDYMDYQVDVQHEQYYYKVLVINTCDIAEDLSQHTSSILLRGEMDEARQVHLEWTPYQGWDQGVEHYILEKRDENGHWQLLKQVDGNVYNYDYQE